MNYLGSKLRELRENQGMLLRQVAAQIDIDTALLSKMERGERRAQKEIVVRAAEALNTSADELIILWIADKINDIIQNEPLANEALKLINAYSHPY